MLICHRRSVSGPLQGEMIWSRAQLECVVAPPNFEMVIALADAAPNPCEVQGHGEQRRANYERVEEPMFHSVIVMDCGQMTRNLFMVQRPRSYTQLT